MMNMKKFALICFLLVIALLSACSIEVSPDAGGTEKPFGEFSGADAATTSPTDKPTPFPEGGGGSGDGDDIIAEPPQDEPAEPDDPYEGLDFTNMPEDDDVIPVETLDKIWVMAVSDTRKVNKTLQTDGGNLEYTMNVTLDFTVVKAAQNSPMGTYKGTADLKYRFDLDMGAIGAGGGDFGGTDESAVVKLESFDLGKIDEAAPAGKRPGDEDYIPYSLVKSDSMAIGAFAISGDGSTSGQMGMDGVTGSLDLGGSGSGALPFRLTVKDGIVEVELTELAPGVKFMGTLAFKAQ